MQVSVYLAAPPILFSPPTFLPSILRVHSLSPFSESILRVHSPSLSSPLCLPYLHRSNHQNMTCRLAVLPSTTLRQLNQLVKEYVQDCNGHDHLKYARFCQETELSRKNRRKLGLGFHDTIQFWQLWLHWVVRNPHLVKERTIYDAKRLLENSGSQPYSATLVR